MKHQLHFRFQIPGLIPSATVTSAVAEKLQLVSNLSGPTVSCAGREKASGAWSGWEVTVSSSERL